MEDRKWMAQIRRGALDLCILAILSHGKRYGYDIAHALSGAEGSSSRKARSTRCSAA